VYIWNCGTGPEGVFACGVEGMADGDDAWAALLGEKLGVKEAAAGLKENSFAAGLSVDFPLPVSPPDGEGAMSLRDLWNIADAPCPDIATSEPPPWLPLLPARRPCMSTPPLGVASPTVDACSRCFEAASVFLMILSKDCWNSCFRPLPCMDLDAVLD
jgi:hypothetical protein